MPYRYFIKLAFNGSDFCGWQIQPGSVTVQAEVENALALILKHKEGIIGCGRTDTGVHARIFYAHFDVEEPLKNIEGIVYKLNRYLPPSISIENIIPVKPGSHARFTAIMREYKYTILTRKDPFHIQTAYLYTAAFDVERMNEGAKMLLNHIDFQCFSKVHTQVSNFRCDLSVAEWKKSDQILEFTIRSDRFLRNMVRSIVGTLLDLGSNKIGIEDLIRILESRDRRKAGRSVPAQGLTLTDIKYPEDIFLQNPEWSSPDHPVEIISSRNRIIPAPIEPSNEPEE